MLGKYLRTSILAVCFAVAASACGSSSADQDTTSTSTSTGGTPQAEHTVAPYSWWIAPGEAKVLQALIDDYKKAHPGAHVTNDGDATGDDARAKLDKDIDSSPPDLFQYNAYYLAEFIKAHPGTVKPLDDFFAEPTLKAAVLPDVLASVTVDGHVAAMPVGLHRTDPDVKAAFMSAIDTFGTVLTTYVDPAAIKNDKFG